jgi:RNA polymerase sigma factor (sigma-70 family)
MALERSVIIGYSFSSGLRPVDAIRKGDSPMPVPAEPTPQTRDFGFVQLMERARAGDPDAANELFEHFARPIFVVARRMLDEQLRRRFDSEDVVNAVWASFLAKPFQKNEFRTPRELAAFLMRMAQNQLVEATRSCVLEKLDYGDDLREEEDPRDFSGRMPTPSQEAVAAERWQRLTADQPQHYQIVLQLLREGRTHAEIGIAIGRSPKVVQRLIQRLYRTQVARQ